MSTIEYTTKNVQSWMATNFLCLNNDKVILIGSNKTYDKLPPLQIKVGASVVAPTTCARNIVITFDCHMSLHNHSLDTCKSAWFHLRNISKIRKCRYTACKRLIHAFMTSKLDLNNSLYFGLPDYLIYNIFKIRLLES